MEPLTFSGEVETIIGNGRLVARARAASAEFVYGGPVSGYRLLVDAAAPDVEATRVWPGRTRYDLTGGGAVTLAADPAADALAVLIEAGPGARWSLDLRGDADGGPPPVDVWVPGAARGADSDGQTAVRLEPRGRAAFLLGRDRASVGDPFAAAEAWADVYAGRGLRLRTPVPSLDRAVAFARAHHRLGYDWTPDGDGRPGGPGSKLVCDIFRWRDVWSRDFGSGFGPGGLAAGMREAVLATLDYEAGRYAVHDPAGLKISDDTSQGGSAEGLGWVLSLVWLVYLHTGDRAWLSRTFDAFAPWVEVWVGRQSGGLVVDTTEWMDHSRFLRLPEGQRTLYSNALWATALDRSARIAEALDRPDAARRYRPLADHARRAVRAAFWNDDGYFNNAVQWGVPDTALMLADTAVAAAERIGSPAERSRALGEVRGRLWRAFGTVTCDPPMRYVSDENDHNAKVWPWWMAWEAKARFLHGDGEGGVHVLRKIADTFEWPTFPGLCEEYFNPEDGSQDELAGHAFITGSGAFLDAVQYGLVGLDVRAPGERHVRLSPAAPRAWDAWQADLDLATGRLALDLSPTALRVDLVDTAVETLDLRIPPHQAVRAVTVDGAAAGVLWDESEGATVLQVQVPAGGRHAVEVALSPASGGGPDGHTDALAVERAFLLQTARSPEDVRVVEGVVGSFQPVEASEIDALGGRGDLVVIAGSAVPYRAGGGAPVPDRLAAYLGRGGSLLLLGPSAPDIDPTAPYHGGAQMGGHAHLLRWTVGEGDDAYDVDPRTGERLGASESLGAVYWGEGPLFAAWEHQVGLFGFGAPCRGVFDREGAALDADVEVGTVYTDWAVREPWVFRPLAFTRRRRQLVAGPRTERYPCAAVLQNGETGARLVVVAPALCVRPGLLRPVLRRALAAGGS